MGIPRKVFIFAGMAALAFGAIIALAARKQGWFSPKDDYFVRFEEADGLNEGAKVTLSGITIGEVEKIAIQEDQSVLVRVEIQRRFANHLRLDSPFKMARPFVLGEKEIIVGKGSSDSPKLKAGDTTIGENTLEITDLLSGGKISPYLKTLENLLDQLTIIINGKEDGQQSLADFYTQTYQTLKAAQRMAYDLRVMRKDIVVTPETKALIHQLSAATKNLKQVVDTGVETLPALKNISRDAVHMMPQLAETLEETTVTLKAAQDSFFLRSQANDIREARKKKRRGRSLASPDPKEEKSE